MPIKPNAKILKLEITDAERDAVKLAATQQGLSMAEWVRRSLRMVIEGSVEVGDGAPVALRAARNVLALDSGERCSGIEKTFWEMRMASPKGFMDQLSKMEKDWADEKLAKEKAKEESPLDASTEKCVELARGLIKELVGQNANS